MLEKYKWYVSYFLFTYDESLQVFHDPEWEASFRYDVIAHLPYLCEERDQGFWDQVSPPTRVIVFEAMHKAKETIAECADR